MSHLHSDEAKAKRAATRHSNANKQHTVRTKPGKTKQVTLNRDTAIKLMCTTCLGWEDHPDTCTDPLCPLFPFKGYSAIADR